MIVSITQSLNGRQQESRCEIDDSLAPQVEAIKACGLRLTVEELMTGMVSQAIEHEEADYDIEIGLNGPGEDSPKNCLERMIRRFDPVVFKKWEVGLQKEEA